MGVYLKEPHKKIVATASLLRHFRAFLASDCSRMKDPTTGWAYGTLNKEEAKRKLVFLINMAINRKAGVPDVISKKAESDYQAKLRRDQRRIREITKERIRHYQFETKEAKTRFSHLLSSNDD